MTYRTNGLGIAATGKTGTTGTAPAVDNTGRDIGTAFTIGGGLLSSIIGGATGTPAATTETPVTETLVAAPATDWTPLYIGGGILVLGGLGWWMLSQKKVAANHRRKTRRNASRPSQRMYHVVAVHEKTGKVTRATATPVTHREGVTIMSKFSRHPSRRIQLEEVRGRKPRRNTKYSYDQSHPYKYDSAGRPVRNGVPRGSKWVVEHGNAHGNAMPAGATSRKRADALAVELAARGWNVTAVRPVKSSDLQASQRGKHRRRSTRTVRR